MSISMEISGLGAFHAKFDGIPERVKQSVKAALLEAGDGIGAISMVECPKLIGNLEGSFFSVWNEEGMAAVIGYSAAHAIFVHEMLDPTASGHAVNWTKPGSKNKFLEDPYNRYKDEIPGWVARKVLEDLEASMQ